MTARPEKTYPDTAKGAIAYLRADSSLDLTNATARPDPQVLGVWLVELHVDDPQIGQEVDAIVYLAGYPTPWGDDRPHNDFECGCHYPDETGEPNELLNCLGLS